MYNDKVIFTTPTFIIADLYKSMEGPKSDKYVTIDENNEELFKYADIAMYRAKKLGKNRICFFEEEMQQRFQNRQFVHLCC